MRVAVAEMTHEMAREKDRQFNLRISSTLKEAGELAAKADQRSLASLMTKLLTDYCRENGFLDAEGRLPKKGRRS
jgi:predicted HicB family RNase H-like nuclease